MDEGDVQHKARAFVASVDVSNIREDLSAYVKAANAKVIKEELGPGESGTTFTRPNGKHIITVNSLETEERQRFTICHELAHIVLGLPSSHVEVPSWSYAKRDINEVYCDMFAAELLMPYQQWQKLVPNDEPSVEVIDFMAQAFGVSFPAAASRYATLASMPCAFVTMDRGMIRHAARSTALRGAKAWIAPKSPIPPGSVAARLRDAGEYGDATAEVAQDVWFENWETGLDLVEVARHLPKYDTTISLLWFEEEDLPAGEVNRFGVREVDDGGLAELSGHLPWPSGKRRR